MKFLKVSTVYSSMRLRQCIPLLLLFFASSTLFAAGADLCDAHDWFSHATAKTGDRTALLCAGAADASFDRRHSAIQKLHRVIRLDSKGDQAYRAHEILYSLFFRAGQYREALREMDAMLAINPRAEDVLGDRPLILGLSQYPDQSDKAKPSVLASSALNDGYPHFPVKVNGKNALWSMDTGADISVMADAEAQALGLTVRPVNTKEQDISGTSFAIKITQVDDLLIGNCHLRHVSFIVLPHTQPPFDDMPTDQQALLGIQVLRALGSIRIGKQEQVEVGVKADRSGKWTPIAFDQAIPVVQLQFENSPLNFTFDSGAQHTTLNPPFASAFPRTVELGEKEQHTLTGVGGSTKQDAIEIPHLTFTLANKDIQLSPATVLLQKTTGTSAWAAGNFGFDLLRQTEPFTIDFRAMRLYIAK
jgi:tetratricopeptide (TPR) repeat protein